MYELLRMFYLVMSLFSCDLLATSLNTVTEYNELTVD